MGGRNKMVYSWGKKGKREMVWVRTHLPGGSQVTKRAEGEETADGEHTPSGAKIEKKGKKY